MRRNFVALQQQICGRQSLQETPLPSVLGRSAACSAISRNLLRHEPQQFIGTSDKRFLSRTLRSLSTCRSYSGLSFTPRAYFCKQWLLQREHLRGPAPSTIFHQCRSCTSRHCLADFQQRHQKEKESVEWIRGYVGKTLAILVVLGGTGYLVAKYRPSQTLCEAEQEKNESTSIVDTKTTKIPRRKISLEAAIAEAQQLCQRVKDESGSPGLVIAVSVDGKQVWAQGLGFADVENHLPCKADSVMRIASVSKSITMAAVAKVMEAGILDLDKPVQAYVPNFPEKTIDGEKVTLTTRHLVSHLGGIRHYSKEYMQRKNEKQQKSDNTSSTPSTAASSSSQTKASASTTAEERDDPRQTLKLNPEFDMPEYFIKHHFGSTESGLALFQDDPLVHKPGTKYLYTSHGWTLVAAVLEGATKRKFPEIVQELFKDLGLENTYLDENQPLIYNRARFYVRDQKNLLVNAPYVDCSYKYAGGGMVSTAPDLVRFGNAMLYSYQFQERQTLQANRAKVGENDEEFSNTNQTRKKLGTNVSGTDKGSSPTQIVGTNTKMLSEATDSDKEVMVSQGGNVPGYLKSSTMCQIWSPVELTKCDWDKDGFYAMGWAVVPEKQDFGCGRKQRFYISHTGGAVGASSVLLILPPLQDEELNKGGDLAPPPRGVVVAMIVNMISVSLCKTALKITRLFENVDME